MKRTEVKFADVKVGDTLYIESAGAEYGKCNKRTCIVVGISSESEVLYVDFGKGFRGHSASDTVVGGTGYCLWKADKQYLIMFKVEGEVPETKHTYSGKVLKHLKIGDIFFLDKFLANSRLEGKFYEVVYKGTGNYHGFDFKEVCDRSVPIYIASHAGDVMTGDMVITLTRPLGKTKEDKIAKLEAKLERIANKLKTLKESGE